MLRRLTLGTFALLCAAGTASAAPLLLPPSSALFFQFNNLEQVNGANSLVVPGYADATGTQGNWGVLNISSIQAGAPSVPHSDISGGPAFFSDDGPGLAQGQITGIFYGIDLTSATTAKGGVIDLFWHDAGSDPITAACLAGTTCLPDAATVGSFTSGTFLARLKFDTGIVPGDGTTTIKSTTDPTTQGASGQADSFASVDTSKVGAWTEMLNADWFWVDTNGDTVYGGPGETRDLRFSTFFNSLNGPGFISPWSDPATGTNGLRSNDPGRVFTAVPEPATLTLLGISLAGLAAVRRRKARQN